MKHKTTRLVAVGALALLSIVFPSCKDGCYKCDCSDVGDTNLHIVCSDDYDNHNLFKADLDYYDNVGCTCKKK